MFPLDARVSRRNNCALAANGGGGGGRGRLSLLFSCRVWWCNGVKFVQGRVAWKPPSLSPAFHVDLPRLATPVSRGRFPLFGRGITFSTKRSIPRTIYTFVPFAPFASSNTLFRFQLTTRPSPVPIEDSHAPVLFGGAFLSLFAFRSAVLYRPKTRSLSRSHACGSHRAPRTIRLER